MIYNVYWFENATPQNVFFHSLGRAKFFVQRLQRNENCQKIFLEEAEAQAAYLLAICKNRHLVAQKNFTNPMRLTRN